MMSRNYLFPRVVELNHQVGRRIGVNVYLVDGGTEWILIDIGFEETVPEIVDLIRSMDYSLNTCRGIIATHADADHVQGLAKAKEMLKTKILAHKASVEPLETGDEITTYATIKAQGIQMTMRPVKIDELIAEGDEIRVGDLSLKAWHTPGHTPGQLAFKMANLLFVGDNIYKDSCVGVIDAHHGSDINAFVKSLGRILADDAEFLLPSHGPVFRRDNRILRKAIERLRGYLKLADFGTCATEWNLTEEWDLAIRKGKPPA